MGLEVRLDGQRVGELTRLMSDRYLPVAGAVAARGGRPGCEALLRHGNRGTQIELRLPAVDAAAARPAIAPPPGPIDVAGTPSAAQVPAQVPSPTPAPAPVLAPAPTPRSIPRSVTTSRARPAPTRDAKPAPAPRPAQAAPASDCHANYTGACVPIASDVDCEGGSGNGPAYVRGPVQVIGKDVYGLDSGGEPGVGCE